MRTRMSNQRLTTVKGLDGQPKAAIVVQTASHGGSIEVPIPKLLVKLRRREAVAVWIENEVICIAREPAEHG